MHKASLVIFLSLLSVVAAIQPWKQADNPNFLTANKAQLDAVSNATGALWFQNITIYSDSPQTGLVPVVNYGYWQSRAYNQNVGAFEEIQAWYRSATTLAIQQINSEVMRPEFTVDPNGGVMRQDQNYFVYWTTNVTFDSASVIGLDCRSSASGSNVVRIAFLDPASQRVVFNQDLITVVPKQRRRYTNTFIVDPTGATLPLTVIFDSFVVPSQAQPPAVAAAFAAYRAGQVPRQPDPAAVAAGVPFNLVYLYTHPSSRSVAADQDRFYAGQPPFTVDSLLRAA